MLKNHHFHLVNISPWPLMGSISTMTLLMGMIKLFNMNSIMLFNLGITMCLLIMYQWWRDISRESTFQGLHTNKVLIGLKMSMILFITSEVFFFISFFWSFFHSSLSPMMELGLIWPPVSIYIFNPFQIPLLNTIILLSSGISVTWTHHSLLNKKFLETSKSLLITIILGIYFTMLQGYEYLNASFTLADSIYGSTFFMATGFHGIHVLIGTIFLLICYKRHNKFHFSKNHHFGFEAAAWYWHFVDIVWLFLYLSIYWWSS